MKLTAFRTLACAALLSLSAFATPSSFASAGGFSEPIELRDNPPPPSVVYMVNVIEDRDYSFDYKYIKPDAPEWMVQRTDYLTLADEPEDSPGLVLRVRRSPNVKGAPIVV